MTIYRNKNWTARNHECTNVRFQITDSLPRNMGSGQVAEENWVALTEEEQQEAADWAELGSDYLAETYGVEYLGGFEGYRFFGHL